MHRRSFLTHTGVGGAIASLAAPALAAAVPSVRWRLASAFPKSADGVYAAAEILSRRVASLTQGKFEIRLYEAGVIAPPVKLLEVVQAGTVEMAHSPSHNYVERDATFAFDSAVPFGLTSRQHTAWFERGGGRELTRDFFREYGILNFLGGNTGTQMGGWFRREVKGVADLKGFKMRISGLGRRVLERVGMSTVQLPPGEIYHALAKGLIDGAEWIGPHDDEKLGLYRVAPYYYTPGWWEAGSSLSFYVNIREWEKLPEQFKTALEVASYEAHVAVQADFDTKNPAALVRLVNNGVKLRVFPGDTLDLCFKAANDIMQEEAARNARFRKVYEPWKRYRQEQNYWASVAEVTMQNYLVTADRK